MRQHKNKRGTAGPSLIWASSLIIQTEVAVRPSCRVSRRGLSRRGRRSDDCSATNHRIGVRHKSAESLVGSTGFVFNQPNRGCGDGWRYDQSLLQPEFEAASGRSTFPRFSASRTLSLTSTSERACEPARNDPDVSPGGPIGGPIPIQRTCSDRC